jgi:hypothetical protein
VTIIRTTEPYGSFRVTYDVITEESAEQGDFAECGWLDCSGCPVDEYFESAWDFRELLSRFAGYYVGGDGAAIPGSVSISPESDFWLSSFWRGIGGDAAITATAYIHRPGWITDGSWLRVCRAIGWRNRYGV